MTEPVFLCSSLTNHGDAPSSRPNRMAAARCASGIVLGPDATDPAAEFGDADQLVVSPHATPVTRSFPVQQPPAGLTMLIGSLFPLCRMSR